VGEQEMQPPLGKSPSAARLEKAGSNISSSLPLTIYPFFFNEIANWCMTLPPIAIKCTIKFLGFVAKSIPGQGISKKNLNWEGNRLQI
jgi:hypothetical protein